MLQEKVGGQTLHAEQRSLSGGSKLIEQTLTLTGIHHLGQENRIHYIGQPK